MLTLIALGTIDWSEPVIATTDEQLVLNWDDDDAAEGDDDDDTDSPPLSMKLDKKETKGNDAKSAEKEGKT